MLRKLAIAMFATTMLAEPVLAADAVKPAAAVPPAPLTATAAPATPAAAKSGSTNAPAVNTVAGGKDVKTRAPVMPAAKATNTNAGAVPAPEVKTIKADKDVKIVKVATPRHRHHSRTWYMVHRIRHFGHTMTAKLPKPVKHVYVHRHPVATHLVKAGKDVPNKTTQ
jgi:hypothetical protein